jgi:inner membrane protein
LDTLTHLLVGHAMGAAASSVAGPLGAAAYWGVLIGNSLPDIDVPLSLLVRRDIKMHRTFTHTLPGAVLLSAGAGLAMRPLMPTGTPFGALFLWILLGTLIHMALDCLNLFGARPFWPLSGRSIDLGVLHILDPFMVLLLGVPTVVVALGRASQHSLALSFLLLWPYILYRIITAHRLYHRLKAEGSLRARVIPWFSGWRYLYETDSNIEFGLWAGGRRRALATYPKDADSPVIQASLSDPQVAAFLASAEYPYALIEEDGEGQKVVWADALRQLRADFRPLRIRIEG